MCDLHQLNKKSTDEQFINFLVEKQVNPIDLLSLSINIKNKKNLNEGFFGGIGGALSGLYHGWKAGYGSKDVAKATEILKNQLDFAYRNFKNSLVTSTGDEAAANKILDNLRKNSDIAITNAIKGEITADKESEKLKPVGTSTPFESPDTEAEIEVIKKPSKKPIKAPVSTGGPPVMTDPTGVPPIPDHEVGDMARIGVAPEPQKAPLSLNDKHFLMNLREFIEVLMKKLNHAEQNKLPFSVLNVLKRLYRFGYIFGSRDIQDLHKEKNINKIGSNQHENMLRTIVEIFTKNNCNFDNERTAENLIKRLEYYENKYGLTGTELNRTLKQEEIWKNLFSAIDDIRKYLNSFCQDKDNPNKCGDAGKTGIEKLLNQLEEANLTLTFKNWLLIKENTLF